MRLSKIILTCLIFSCISLSISSEAWAANDQYIVEIIIFRQPNTASATQEIWPGYPAIPNNQSSSDIQSSGSKHLTAVANRLNKTGYPVLYHQAKVVKLNHNGRAKSLPLRIETSVTRDWVVAGQVNVQNLGFFKVDLNLSTQPWQSMRGNIQTFPTSSQALLPWISTRRLHTKELNYFDHPLYGMLVAIYPS